ncbi:MAG: peptidoglycan editing factor PgeF [Pseudomonadota bacterium]
MAAIGWLPAGFAAPPGVQAGTTTRHGGVSEGSRAAFNLAAHVGDEPTAVAANRAQLRTALALPAEPLWLEQVHGTDVVVHDGRRDVPRADAAVAFEPGRVLAVLTADCLPVVFASRDGRRIGVAHAGWRGLVAGVLERTVAALGVPAAELVAWLGPAIGMAAFEVGEEVRAAFVAAAPGDATRFVANSRGRWQADLAELARARLERAGLVSIADAALCTYADPARFYSHRRDPASGRQATLVWRQS